MGVSALMGLTVWGWVGVGRDLTLFPNHPLLFKNKFKRYSVDSLEVQASNVFQVGSPPLCFFPSTPDGCMREEGRRKEGVTQVCERRREKKGGREEEPKRPLKVTATSAQPEGVPCYGNSEIFQLESCSHKSHLLIKITQSCLIVVFVENYRTVISCCFWQCFQF